MKELRSLRPSPGLIVAILALVACATGVALAQPASDSAVTKKKVKKIADKEIERLAAGLSVANAANAANAATLEGNPASAFAASASEPYHEIGAPGEPPFEHAWGNHGAGTSTAAFYKDSQGVVHLKGTLSTSSDLTSAFTLPPGYRPNLTLGLPIAWPGGGSLTIRADGVVIPDCAGGALCSGAGIDGLSFRAGV